MDNDHPFRHSAQKFRLISLAIIFFAIVAAGLVDTRRTAAQDMGELQERFRKECREECAVSGRKGQKLHNLVQECVQRKMQVARDEEPFQFREFTPRPLKAGLGPAKARGVIYYIQGFSQNHYLAAGNAGPYFLKTLNDEGWDVIGAKIEKGQFIPQKHLSMVKVAPAAVAVRQRLKELKAQGYSRIILAGHSWGAWVSLKAAQQPDLAADILLLSAPNATGPRSSPGSTRCTPGSAPFWRG